MIMPNDAPYLSEFCEEFAPQARGFLVPHAAEVILMTRIGSIRLATKYFTKKFNRKFSTKPINDIIAKVKRGEIVVTEEEIAAKAKCVPLAAQFVEKCPWMLNPRSSKTLVEEPTPSAKQTIIEKKIAKKKAKEKEKEAAEEKEPEVRKFVPRTRDPGDSESSGSNKPEVMPEQQAALDRLKAMREQRKQQQ
jgi:hypothetical protein